MNAHSYTDNHRGVLISDIIKNSDHISLNKPTPTRVQNTTLQVEEPSSPGITTISTALCNHTLWRTEHALRSDHHHHKHTHQIQQNRCTYSNYKKANWEQYTTDTEADFTDIDPPTNMHRIEH